MKRVHASRADGVGTGAPELDDSEILPPDALEDRLARVLHLKMEHLDPTGKFVWESLTEREKTFYRCCIQAILCSGLVAPTKG
jgi:hypothetical protein